MRLWNTRVIDGTGRGQEIESVHDPGAFGLVVKGGLGAGSCA
jgi:hypothetical protein